MLTKEQITHMTRWARQFICCLFLVTLICSLGNIEKFVSPETADNIRMVLCGICISKIIILDVCAVASIHRKYTAKDIGWETGVFNSSPHHNTFDYIYAFAYLNMWLVLIGLIIWEKVVV